MGSWSPITYRRRHKIMSELPISLSLQHILNLSEPHALGTIMPATIGVVEVVPDVPELGTLASTSLILTAEQFDTDLQLPTLNHHGYSVTIDAERNSLRIHGPMLFEGSSFSLKLACDTPRERTSSQTSPLTTACSPRGLVNGQTKLLSQMDFWHKHRPTSIQTMTERVTTEQDRLASQRIRRITHLIESNVKIDSTREELNSINSMGRVGNSVEKPKQTFPIIPPITMNSALPNLTNPLDNKEPSMYKQYTTQRSNEHSLMSIADLSSHGSEIPYLHEMTTICVCTNSGRLEIDLRDLSPMIVMTGAVVVNTPRGERFVLSSRSVSL